jgi:hypothetical protein
MPQQTLMTGVAQVARTGGYTGTGAVSGTLYCVPFGRGVERFVEVQISFSADPGAYVFELRGSNDVAVAPTIIGANIAGTTVSVIVKRDAALFLRLDQVSKANAVTANATITLL